LLAFIDDDHTLAPDWLAGVERAGADCNQASLMAHRRGLMLEYLRTALMLPRGGEQVATAT